MANDPHKEKTIALSETALRQTEPSLEPDTPAEQSATDTSRIASWWRDTALRKFINWQMLYLLMLPTIASMLVFSYYPKLDVIIMSLYRWQPPTLQEYVGVKNFQDAFADPLFWQSFKLVGILLLANLLKMWPGIIAAIALHRMLSDRWRYIYQVCFVIPMVVPGMVWLLIWKSFYDPDFGLFNRFLSATGMMEFIHALDGTRDAPGLFPRLAESLAPSFTYVVDPLFGGVGGMIVLGAFILGLGAWESNRRQTQSAYSLLILGTVLLPLSLGLGIVSGIGGVLGGAVITIALMYALSRAMGQYWILWPFLIIGGIIALYQELWRLPVLLGAAIAITLFLRFKFDTFRCRDLIRIGGYGLIFAGCALVVLGKIWVSPTGQFAEGAPAWLGNKDLVIPALIFWGFPWVGTIGVLIYLSGLQQIPHDVYEAAELDGVGPVGKLFHIELPLIMTQIRINLIFMTIGTLTSYEMFLILLGADGGPANRGMVPGLYMFKKAFEEGRFGYACALGMVLFVIVLLLTIVYNKYVKVEK